MDYGDVAAWGVATQAADGSLQVHEHRSLSAAEQAAERVPRLTVTGAHPITGAHHSLTDVWPVVSRHPERGWTIVGISWPIPTS